MSFSDCFYPENLRRRCQAEHLYQQLHQGTLPNVHTTQVFMDYMTDCMQRQLRFAQCLSDNDELNQTYARLLGHMAQSQQHLPMVDRVLKQQLTAESYQSLQGFNEPSTEAALKLRSALVAILWVMVFLVMAISVLCVCYYIITVVIDLSLQVINLVGALLVTVFYTVCLGFGADVLLSTALGALEKHQLKQKIKQYERALSEIQPQQ